MQKTIGFIACLLLLSSCSFSVSNQSSVDLEEVPFAREDVLGEWTVDRSQLSGARKGTHAGQEMLVTFFRLEADSTASVIMDVDGTEVKLPGQWEWKYERTSKGPLKVHFRADVLLRVEASMTNVYMLGLNIHQEEGELILGISDRHYKRIE